MKSDQLHKFSNFIYFLHTYITYLGHISGLTNPLAIFEENQVLMDRHKRVSVIASPAHKKKWYKSADQDKLSLDTTFTHK